MSVHHTPSLEETTSITNPKPAVDTRAHGLFGCWENQLWTLTVWSCAEQHQARLLHRTSIALSLARGRSQNDGFFSSIQKNIAWIPMLSSWSTSMTSQPQCQDMCQTPCMQMTWQYGALKNTPPQLFTTSRTQSKRCAAGLRAGHYSSSQPRRSAHSSHCPPQRRRSH